MPSAPHLETSGSVDLASLDAVTVYWFGRVSAGSEGALWGHNLGNNRELTLRAVNGEQLRAKMTNAANNPLEKIFDFLTPGLIDEHICVAVVFDLTKTDTSQIAAYVNGSPDDWSDNETYLNEDGFGDSTFILGDNGTYGAPLIRCQAFAVFPEAHTQAQVQAVSDDWFEKSGVNV